MHIKIYMGIDPGKKGGIALLTEDGQTEAYPYAEQTLQSICHTNAFHDVICCLEQVHAMPKQGVTSMFTFGMGYGYIKGTLEAYSIPYQEIPPQKWKKEFGLNTDKQKSIDVARKLFPKTDFRPSERCRVDNDGMAEAALMAEYARRKL